MTKGRFAPTPSGDLHLGNIRTAIVAWLHARATGGSIQLRIDDLDVDRCREEFAFRQLDDLAWLGLTWDGELLRQSERIDRYRDALAQLQAAGVVYPCFCTRAEIKAAASAPHGDEGPVYGGTCRALDPAVAAERVAAGERHALRLAVPPGVERFDDFVHGAVAIDVAATAGDLVLVRSDGVIGYQLACAVDDAQPDMTHIVRGEDLLPSAAFQRVIMRLLDREPPAYGHVPLMLGDDGARLAKRHGAITLREHRDHGATPESVVGMLAGMFGIGDGSPTAIEELVPLAAGLAG
ncbi:MAG: tRNA glutamyl-Q(34) synthetase GluQRS [Gaiellales bacterium]